MREPVVKVRNVKGTRDLLPPETTVWTAVEKICREVFGRYGYAEIRTPILEETELFVRSVGESTDIVGKEMYTFADKKGRSLTLRPESTAAVARAYVQHGMRSWPAPVRLFYIGPQFRYERPQKGRYRQFYQIGAELLGDPGPLVDAELLLMLVRFLRRLEFRDLVVRLNTVGDRESRARYASALREFLGPHREQLGRDSRRRLDSNPLRILDTKVKAEQELLRAAPGLDQVLSDESRDHFGLLCSVLDDYGVAYEVDDRLVRGLDYYTRTVFEIASSELGAQDSILGGGRYDGLVSDLGGDEVPGIGFAIGQDRLVEVLPVSFRQRYAAVVPVFVLAVGGTPQLEALRLAEELRQSGVAAVAELAGLSVKAGMKRADRLGSRFAALIGEDELASEEVTVKDLGRGEQERVARSDVGPWLAKRESE